MCPVPITRGGEGFKERLEVKVRDDPQSGERPSGIITEKWTLY